MDYRSYENKINEIKNDIIANFSLKEEKNFEYSQSIVNSYLESLNKGDISIKSFKLKIVHSEHAYEKSVNEFDELLKAKYQDLVEFLDNFFLEYEKSLVSFKYFPTRKADLLQLNHSLKRKKQENITRINNLDKDLSQKIKDANNLISEKQKACTSAVNEINRRLSIDLQRNIDNCNKESLPLERELLDVDEKDKIKEIKLKIKEIRAKSIEEQNKLKSKAYDALNETETSFAKEISEIELKLELDKKEHQLKVLQCNKEIDLLQLEEAKNIFMYDYQKDVQSLDLYENYLNSYINVVKAINEKTLNKESKEDKEFIELHFNMKSLEYTLRFFKNNFYDPVIRMINKIVSLFNECKNLFEEKIDLLYKTMDTSDDEIFDKLYEYDDDIYKVKKIKKSELEDNIKIGLSNLFNSKYILSKHSILAKTLESVLDIINEKAVRINTIFLEESSKILITKNNLEETDLIEQNIDKLETDFKLYKDSYLLEKENEKNKYESNQNSLDEKINKKFVNDSEINEKDVKKIVRKNKNNIDKKIKLNNKNNKKNHKLASRNLKEKKRIL